MTLQVADLATRRVAPGTGVVFRHDVQTVSACGRSWSKTLPATRWS